VWFTLQSRMEKAFCLIYLNWKFGGSVEGGRGMREKKQFQIIDFLNLSK